MKIAIIALPMLEEQAVTPPLQLSYLASILEQQHHIVRIYDLAITRQLSSITERVQAFRPHCIVLANDTPAQAAEIQQAFSSYEGSWVLLNNTLRGSTPTHAIARIIASYASALPDDDRSIIIDALRSLCKDLDTLPFPARHLLEIEHYPMKTASGDLQTNILISQHVDSVAALRNPRLIISELRSLIHEYGVWHVRFDGLPLTSNSIWLHDLMYDLALARLDIKWEGIAQYQALNPDIIHLMRRAGCEALTLEFDAMQVLDSQQERMALLAMIETLRGQDISVRGHALLEPRYSAIPAVVDMSSTFGLDDIRFSIHRLEETAVSSETAAIDQLIGQAQAQYRSVRDRQVFIKRFGQFWGPKIWRLDQAGLLPRIWQRPAAGNLQ